MSYTNSFDSYFQVVHAMFWDFLCITHASEIVVGIYFMFLSYG